MTADFSEVQHVLDGARGLRAWRAIHSIGTLISIEFGAKISDDPPRGEYSLFVDGSPWRWENDDRVLVSSGDPDLELERVLPQFDSRTLTGIHVELPSLSAWFEFDDGSRFRTFTTETKQSNDQSHWVLFLPDGRYFAAGPGSSWSFKASLRMEKRSEPHRRRRTRSRRQPGVPIDFSEAVRRLDGAIGKTVLDARELYGERLVLDFGPATRDESDPDRYRLWTEQSAWRWETADRILASSGDPGTMLDVVLPDMNSLTLTGIQLSPTSLSARFDFDDGSRLHTFTRGTQPGSGTHWRMYLPDGSMLQAGPAAAWTADHSPELQADSELTDE